MKLVLMSVLGMVVPEELEPGSFGVDAANTVNTGLSNTAYNQIRLYANWDTTYENIRRYCTEPENEFCY